MSSFVSIVLQNNKGNVGFIQTISSLNLQNFNEFEVIVVVDQYETYIKDVVTKLQDDRFRVLQQNTVNSLTDIVSACNGEYIILSEYGDIFEIDFLIELQTFSKENLRVDFYFSWFKLNDEIFYFPVNQEMLFIISECYQEVPDASFLLRKDFLYQCCREKGFDWKMYAFKTGFLKFTCFSYLNVIHYKPNPPFGTVHRYSFLRELLASYTIKEYYLHLSLMRSTYYTINMSDADYLAWFEKLLTANEEKQYFNQRLFATFLSFQWQTIQNKHTQYEIKMLYQIEILKYATDIGEEEIKFIQQYFIQEQPQHILEFGCGDSTLLIAELIKKSGSGSVFISIEHDPEWLSVIEYYLQEKELSDYVNLIYVPLESALGRASSPRWYKQSVLSEHLLPNFQIDFLRIGVLPIAGHKSMDNRCRVIPFIYNSLKLNSTILLSNIDNEYASDSIQFWEDDYKLNFQKLGDRIAVSKKMTDELPRASRSPKLSFCITCKNRCQQIQKTLLKNLTDQEDLLGLVDFVLVDFGSTDGLKDWINTHFKKYLDNGMLKYYYTEELPFWHVSIAKNTAHMLATGDVLVSLDCDNYIGYKGALFVINYFVVHNKMVLHQFSGKFRDGSCGRIGLRKSDFLRIGGYNEQFEAVGYDDLDFLRRLEAVGLTILVDGNSEYNLAEQNSKVESTSNCSNLLSWQEMNFINYRMSNDNIDKGELVANNGVVGIWGWDFFKKVINI